MNKIEERLSRAIESAPSLSVEGLKKAEIQKMEEHDYITRQQETKLTPMRKRFALAAAGMCMCFLLMLNLPIHQRASAIIDVDINPSIELALNKKNEVIRMEAINHDGENILKNLDYKNQDVEEVVFRMLDEMIRQGYLTKDKLDNNILLSVEHSERDQAEELTIRLNSAVTKYLSERRIPVKITDQHMLEDKKERKVAEKYGISLGKLTLIRKIMKEHEHLKIEDLSKLSLSELVDLLNESREKPGKKKPDSKQTQTEASVSTSQRTMTESTERTAQKKKKPVSTTRRKKKATTEKRIRDEKDDDDENDNEDDDSDDENYNEDDDD